MIVMPGKLRELGGPVGKWDPENFQGNRSVGWCRYYEILGQIGDQDWKLIRFP